MADHLSTQILNLALEAQKLGIPNIFQPGQAREYLIAEALGHAVVTSKHDVDALTDSGQKCEYLSTLEGGSVQFDRMFTTPTEKRQKSLWRIDRNDFVFVAVFAAECAVKLLRIYELPKSPMIDEANRQLDRSRNAISHVHFPTKFVEEHGRLVWKSPLL